MTSYWILILFAHTGALGSGNSNSLTTQEFYTQQTCETAGKKAKSMIQGTVKQIEYVCVSK